MFYTICRIHVVLIHHTHSYLDPVIRTEWHLFRQVDDDWMSLGVLHQEFVGVSVRGGLTTQARASVVHHSYWLTGDAKRLVHSQRCSEVLVGRHICQLRLDNNRERNTFILIARVRQILDPVYRKTPISLFGSLNYFGE